MNMTTNLCEGNPSYAQYVKGCRCADCRAANTIEHNRLLERRKVLRETGQVEVLHGSVNTYNNYGCRCADCTRVHAEYQQYRRWHLKFQRRLAQNKKAREGR